MSRRTYLLSALALSCLAIYLFATAPAPLPETRAAQADVPVGQMLTAMQGINDAVRGLWTRDIVQEGGRVGLEFDERWRDDGVQAGPLPALFLREMARSLERHPVRLSLFLGSDSPIAKSNAFDAEQLVRFRQVRESREPQFFVVADTGLHTGMFADVAVTDACIDCHNDHPESPKRDWQRGDVMGAVTWSYPAGAVTIEEFLRSAAALHQAVREAYESYLEKAKRFDTPPVIGTQWPREGYFLPDADTFMSEVYRRSAPATLALLDRLAEERRQNPRAGSQRR